MADTETILAAVPIAINVFIISAICFYIRSRVLSRINPLLPTNDCTTDRPEMKEQLPPYSATDMFITPPSPAYIV